MKTIREKSFLSFIESEGVRDVLELYLDQIKESLFPKLRKLDQLTITKEEYEKIQKEAIEIWSEIVDNIIKAIEITYIPENLDFLDGSDENIKNTFLIELEANRFIVSQVKIDLIGLKNKGISIIIAKKYFWANEILKIHVELLEKLKKIDEVQKLRYLESKEELINNQIKIKEYFEQSKKIKISLREDLTSIAKKILKEYKTGHIANSDFSDKFESQKIDNILVNNQNRLNFLIRLFSINKNYFSKNKKIGDLAILYELLRFYFNQQEHQSYCIILNHLKLIDKDFNN